MAKKWKNIKVKRIIRTTIKTTTINSSRRIIKQKVKRFVKGPLNFRTRLERKCQRQRKMRGQSANIECGEECMMVDSCRTSADHHDTSNMVQSNEQDAVNMQFDCAVVDEQTQSKQIDAENRSNLGGQNAEKNQQSSPIDIPQSNIECAVESNVESKPHKEGAESSNLDGNVAVSEAKVVEILHKSCETHDAAKVSPACPNKISQSSEQQQAVEKNVGCKFVQLEREGANCSNRVANGVTESNERRYKSRDRNVSSKESSSSSAVPQSSDSSAEPKTMDIGFIKQEKAAKSKEIPQRGHTNEVKNDQRVCCWKGHLRMKDVSEYSTSIIADKKHYNLLNRELSAKLSVVGTIDLESVWNYLGKLKRAQKQIIAFSFAPKSTTHEPFSLLFNYLLSRQRIGVIKITSQLVKDFYLLPLNGNYDTYTPVLLEIIRVNKIKMRKKQFEEFIGVLVKK